MSAREIVIPVLVIAESHLLPRVRKFYAKLSEAFTKRNIKPTFIEITTINDINKIDNINKEYSCIVILTCGLVKFLQHIAEKLLKLRVPTALVALLSPSLISVPSAMQLSSILKNRLGHVFFLADPEDERSIIGITSFIRTADALKDLLSSNVGVIEGYSNIGLLKSLNMKIKYISKENLRNKMESISDDLVKKYFRAYIESRLLQVRTDVKDVHHQIRLYIAIKRIIDEENLNAVLTPCPLLGTTPCLALSLLEEEGIITECLGSPSLFIGSLLLRSISRKPTFTGFISTIELHDRVIRILSCGKAPVSMAIDPRDVELSPQPNTWIAPGVTLSFSTKRARSTILRIIQKEDGLKIIVASGETFPVMKNLLKEDIPVWPHVFMKMDSSPLKLIETLEDPFINVTLGDYRRFIMYLAKIINAELIMI